MADYVLVAILERSRAPDAPPDYPPSYLKSGGGEGSKGSQYVEAAVHADIDLRDDVECLRAAITELNDKRIICSYADGQRHKARLFRNMAREGHVQDRGTWEFHHVVERQHYADLDFGNALSRIYKTRLPCVLIAREEHRAYNSLLHIKQTEELYRESGLPRDVQERAAAAAAHRPAEHARLRQRAEGLRSLYRRAYGGDPVLTKIADNVIDDALKRLTFAL